jgi:membrane-bound lytic murein transglycosylase D
VRLALLATPVMLLLSACATTGTEPAIPTASTAKSTASQQTAPPSTPGVDEHLYRPHDGAGYGDYDTVWERLVDRFDLPDCAAQTVNLQWARWYADRPDYMERIFNRAEPWIYHIAEELEKRNMPGELALLPIVESAYDPFAYSRGRAMGAWQFISGTARTYGLKQNWWYDGRRDVWASTEAALDYLSYMHEMFEGDWLLALAGYNSGEGRVMRQIDRNRAAGRPIDFWSLKLPSETKGYIPKLLGLACLFKNPGQYDFKIAPTPDKPVITAIDLGQQTDLVMIAQMSEVPVDVLFTLNPGFNRWATSPEGPFRIVLPLENAAVLENNLQAVDMDSLMKWDQVIVERGDSLSTLAQRHHVPIEVLRSSNGLKGDMIRPGQKLRLPRDDQLMVDPLYAAAATELQRLQAGLIAPDLLNHRVKQGETLSVIARNYHVSVADLQRWNHISDPRTLRAGASLVVFHAPTETPANGGNLQYTVQQGDSLWSIARKYNVRVNDLKVWNDLGTDTTIRPGQSIRIQL